MKKKMLWVFFSVGFFASTLVRADAPAVQFGVLDMQKVILSVEEGKSARAELEKEIKGKETELQKKKEELDKMNNDWKDQSALLSEEARTKKQKDFQDKFMDLRNAEMTFQNEIKKKETEATQKIAANVAKMSEDLAKKKGLTAVFETNSSGLLYLQNPVNITDEIIAEYDKTNKGVGKISKK